MLSRSYLIIALALGALMMSSEVDAGVAGIWSVGDGDKFGPEVPMPGSPNPSVKLFGMRNETVAFQVIVAADEQGASMHLSLPSIGPIKNTESQGQWVGRHIEIFWEGYLPIAERSQELVWKPGSAAEPQVPKSIPDILVPHDAPLLISPNKSQAFWIDVWIPRDLEAGLHQGTVQVISSGRCQDGCDISVELEVLDRSMPEVATARSMLWFSGGDRIGSTSEPRYFANPTETERKALRLQHYQLARRHRITLFWGKFESLTIELDALLSGQAFSQEAGYDGPGQGRGQDLLVLHAYGGELDAESAAEWLGVAKRYSDLVDVFGYIMDEPGRKAIPEVNRRIEVSKPMTSLVTTAFNPQVDTDIFAAPADLYRQADAKRAEGLGKTTWIYNGVRPFTGTYAIDDVGISPRVNPWIQYKLGIERWFYWDATYYEDFQGKRGAVDVLGDPLNFSNRHGDRINGDGLLMYPGRDLLFPEHDMGVAAPLASIRLKNWRRGIEDVEYLVMAREAGYSKEVDALLDVLLPVVAGAADRDAPVSWPEDGARWRLARRYLFELLRDGSSSVSLAEISRAPESSWAKSSRWFASHRRKAAVAAGGMALLAICLWWWLRRRRSAV